jgi:four helix bundle protein
MSVTTYAKSFPANEKYLLEDQLLRSVRSISANIAEGFGRYHHKESAQYYRQAKGSLIETADHLICAYDEKYLSKTDLKHLLDQIEECGRVLNGLIRYQSQRAKK